MAHLGVADLPHAKGHSIPKKSKIVIVGAGMAGLYTAWRLINETDLKREDIVILEKLNRTGGRLDSDLIDFKEGDKNFVVKEEEGGMRFTFDSMDNLMSLFMTLPLTDKDKPKPDTRIADDIVPFPMSSDGNNRLFFRGVPFSQKDAPNTWSELYNLSYPEVNQTPSEIVNTVYNRILAANPEFTAKYKKAEQRKGPDYWQAFRLECQWQGTIMKDWSLWNLFANMGYTNEAIQMVYQSSGFNGTFLSQMNGGVAYQLLKEFPADPEFRTLKEGFSTLPNSLVAQVGKESIFLNTTVTELDKDGAGFSLSYIITDEAGNFDSEGVIHGEKVILALPRLALETLFVRSNAFNVLKDQKSKDLWNTLQTSSNQPLVKINLYYDKAWWGSQFLLEDDAVAFGPNFADLPVGSIYPFYSVNNQLAAALEYEDCMKNNGNDIPKKIRRKLKRIHAKKYAKPAALTIYCDFMNVNYWIALQRNGELFTSEMQEEQNKKNPQTVYAASKRIVEIATEYFKKVFNTTFVPQPVLTSARIWSGSTTVGVEPSERFGYGVHQWALGAQDDEVQDSLREPLPNLFTCNEAYSDYQGWVEGSLRSANLMLKKGWDLDPYSEIFEMEHKKTPEKAVSEFYNANAKEMIREYIDPEFEICPNVDKEEKSKNRQQHMRQRMATHGVELTNYDLD